MIGGDLVLLESPFGRLTSTPEGCNDPDSPRLNPYVVFALLDMDDISNNGRVKRQKISNAAMDPKNNPYLAHMYDDASEENGYGNGYGYGGFQSTNSASSGAALKKFKRHSTTAAQASQAEDGPDNPFTSRPLSKQYLSILKTRRNLPVHAQR